MLGSWLLTGLIRSGEPASVDGPGIGGLRQAPPTVSSPVLQSAGELENDEHTAAVMMQMVRTASRFRLAGSADPPFKRMSGKTRTRVSPPRRRVPHLAVTCVHSDPGRLRLRGDSFCSESLCCQTSQPAPANRSLDCSQVTPMVT